MGHVVPRPRTARQIPQRLRASEPAAADHDLPVLATELEPRQRPEWPKLLEEGVQPALILGAERRTHGRR